MKQTTVCDRQTLLDIALENCGSLEAAFDIALENGLSMSDDIEVGTVLNLPAQQDSAVVDYWKNNGIKASTAIEAVKVFDEDGNETTTSLEGIGFWTIKGTFIVS